MGSGAAGFPWLLQKLAPLRSGDAAAYAIALVTLHRRPAAVMPLHRVVFFGVFFFFDVFFDTGRGFGGSSTTAVPSLATRSAFSPDEGRFRFLSSSLSCLTLSLERSFGKGQPHAVQQRLLAGFAASS